MSFSTTYSLQDVLVPDFLGRHFSSGAVLSSGDLVAFSAGPSDARVHGLLVVTEVVPPSSHGTTGAVHTALLASTPAPVEVPVARSTTRARAA